MPKYDRQVILCFLTGSGDEIVASAARKLHEKAISNRLATVISNCTPFDVRNIRNRGLLPKQSKTASCGELTINSRLYIIGHGSWKRQTVAGLNAKEVANFVTKIYRVKSVGLISLVACSVARGAGEDDIHEVSIEHSSGSFAQEFHFLLKERGLATKLHSRLYDITTFETKHGFGKATTSIDEEKKQKTTTHHRSNSKILWYWEGGLQKKKYVVYEKSNDYSATMDL